MTTRPRKRTAKAIKPDEVIGPARWLDLMPLDTIKRAKENPKGHDEGLILESFELHGYAAPMVLDERTKRLVAGHGRLDGLEVLRDREADPPDGVVVLDDGRWAAYVARGWRSRNDEQARQYLLVDNRAGELGGWERQALADMLGPMMERDALAGTGFDRTHVDDLLASLRPPDFDQQDPEQQPRLDERTPIVCPNCGHEFSRG
jgi:hypothetical protein